MTVLALISVLGPLAIQRVPLAWRAMHPPAPPAPERFHLADRPHLGATSAPLQLVVVERYDCLSCRISAERLTRALTRPGLQVTLLQGTDGSASSENAALASQCVWRLSPIHFWAVRRLLFRQQGPPGQDWFGPRQLTAVAQAAHLAPARLQRCLQDPHSLRRQVDDAQRANRLHGDPLLPALYLNGHWLPFRTALQPDLLTARVQATSSPVRNAISRSRPPPQGTVPAAAPSLALLPAFISGPFAIPRRAASATDARCIAEGR